MIVTPAEHPDMDPVQIIRDLVDDDDCSYDHNGNCQAHYWFDDSECANARAKRYLEGIDENSTSNDRPHL